MLPSTLEAVFFLSSQRHTEHPAVYSWYSYKAALGQVALFSDMQDNHSTADCKHCFIFWIHRSWFFYFFLQSLSFMSVVQIQWPAKSSSFFRQTAIALLRFKGLKHTPTVSETGLTIWLYCSHYHQYWQRKQVLSCSIPNGAIHVAALQGINSPRFSPSSSASKPKQARIYGDRKARNLS